MEVDGYLKLRGDYGANRGLVAPPSETGLYLLGRHTAYIVGEELKAGILEDGDDNGAGWLNIEDFWDAAVEDRRPDDRVPPQGSAAFSRVLYEISAMDRQKKLDNPSLGLDLEGFTHNTLLRYRLDSAKLGWERTSFLLRQNSALAVWIMLSENYPYLRGTYRILTRVLHDTDMLDFDQGSICFAPHEKRSEPQDGQQKLLQGFGT